MDCLHSLPVKRQDAHHTIQVGERAAKVLAAKMR
jgi:hypothetical protein